MSEKEDEEEEKKKKIGERNLKEGLADKDPFPVQIVSLSYSLVIPNKRIKWLFFSLKKKNNNLLLFYNWVFM